MLNSLPIHTPNSSSKHPFHCRTRPLLIPAKAILLQKSQDRGKLHLGQTYWEGLIWQGLSCQTQFDKWRKGGHQLFPGGSPPHFAHLQQVVLKASSKEDPNLAREIHHHRQFVHPHIARLYEVIITESLVWLVLEFCPGTLARSTHTQRPAPR
jgi:serine/threonine protein kinase